MSGRAAYLLAAVRGGYGVALLWSPGPLTRAAAGHATGSGARATARVLGVRQLVQAGITSGDPRPRTLMLGTVTDAAHAASMVALAVADRRWRRAALLEALVAATLAAAGLRAARRVGPGPRRARMDAAGPGSPEEIQRRIRAYRDRLSTIKTHVNQIFAKTGSRDRPQAIVYAHRHGIARAG